MLEMLSSWKVTVRTSVLVVILYSCINLASGINIEVIPNDPKVGTTVTFKVTGVTGTIRFSTWYKGQSTNASDQILNFFPPHTSIEGVRFFSEAHGQANGSLVITNVKKDFSSYYTVQVQTNTLQQSSVQLTVSGIGAIGLSPLAILLGVLLCSEFSFL